MCWYKSTSGAFWKNYFLLLWGSHYSITIFSQPFTSPVINHAPFNYWVVIYSPNPFQILPLIFPPFLNPIWCLWLITLLRCHRLFQYSHGEAELVWPLAALRVPWIVCHCDISTVNAVTGRWTVLNCLDSYYNSRGGRVKEHWVLHLKTMSNLVKKSNEKGENTSRISTFSKEGILRPCRTVLFSKGCYLWFCWVLPFLPVSGDSASPEVSVTPACESQVSKSKVTSKWQMPKPGDRLVRPSRHHLKMQTQSNYSWPKGREEALWCI